MKKILFAVKNMNIGGVEKSLLSLLNTIDQSEYQVNLLLLENYGGFMDMIPDWVNVIIYPGYSKIRDEVNLPPLTVIKRHITSGRFLRALSLLSGYLKAKLTSDQANYYRAVFHDLPSLEQEYDIAVSYTSIISYLTWIVNYHVSAKKRIGWIHFDISKLGVDRNFMLTLHSSMDKIYVVSQAALETFTEFYPELKNKCELRYNIIDQKTILGMAEEPEESIRIPGKKTIITLGRLTTEKGQDIIPEIAANLKAKGYDFCWYLIGAGALRQKIEQEIMQWDVADCVKLLGTKKNPYPYLTQADLYVQTSIHEGYCITLGEAKIFGMPIVSTDFSGAHEQLDNVLNCSVVPRDVNHLSSSITTYLEGIIV